MTVEEYIAIGFAALCVAYNVFLAIVGVRRVRRDPGAGSVSPAPFEIISIPGVAGAGLVAGNDQWLRNVLLCMAFSTFGYASFWLVPKLAARHRS